MDDFGAFTHTHDPVMYNAEENLVYCKFCHFYVISHAISKKKDKFYVNRSQLCSFPLTGRWYHMYDKGTARKQFFEAQHLTLCLKILIGAGHVVLILSVENTHRYHF